MQFYIIDKDAKTNAEWLPNYAIKKVNVREGYQILSDIGHYLDIHWENQNKEYNKYHPNISKYYKTKEMFNLFYDCYAACAEEYRNRFNKDHKYIAYFNYNVPTKDVFLEKIINMSDEVFTMKYLLDRKSKHLTNEYISSLQYIYFKAGLNGQNRY